MTFNVELADRVMGFIEANPDLHDQKNWVCASSSAIEAAELDTPVTECETTACFAGWTVLLEEKPTVQDILWETGGTVAGHHIFGDRIEGVLSATSIQREAQMLLGLTYDQAEELFNAYNTVEDLKLMIKAYANGEPAYRRYNIAGHMREQEFNWSESQIRRAEILLSQLADTYSVPLDRAEAPF